MLVDEDQPSWAPKSEIIQGGIYKANSALLSKIPGIRHETTAQSGLSHTNGTLSLARLAPGTAHTEFFICVGDQRGYDFGGKNNPDGQGYAAFGRVVKGMDVVNRMYAAPQRDGQLTPQIYITGMRRLNRLCKDYILSAGLNNYYFTVKTLPASLELYVTSMPVNRKHFYMRPKHLIHRALRCYA